MQILEAFIYLMTIVGTITTGFTLVAYWMIWVSFRNSGSNKK